MEIIKILSNFYELPVAQLRKARILRDEDFCVPEAEEFIEDDNICEVGAPVEDLALPHGLDAADAEEVSAGEKMFTRAEVPSGSADARALVTEFVPGRADGKTVRPRKGSTRPNNLSLEPWRTSSARQKRYAIFEYEAFLATALVAMAARYSSGVPAQPRQVGDVVDQVHRDKDGAYSASTRAA
jgi:hypothetical protein